MEDCEDSCPEVEELLPEFEPESILSGDTLEPVPVSGFDPRDASNALQDKDNDRYTNIEEYLNGTDPTEYMDYIQPENNINMLK